MSEDGEADAGPPGGSSPHTDDEKPHPRTMLEKAYEQLLSIPLAKKIGRPELVLRVGPALTTATGVRGTHAEHFRCLRTEIAERMQEDLGAMRRSTAWEQQCLRLAFAESRKLRPKMRVALHLSVAMHALCMGSHVSDLLVCAAMEVDLPSLSSDILCVLRERTGLCPSALRVFRGLPAKDNGEEAETASSHGHGEERAAPA